MGTKSILFCPSCRYEVLTSGGPNRGFFFYTNTYVCTTCRTLRDLEVTPARLVEIEPVDGKPTYRKQTGKRISGQHCPSCNGTTFKRWNSRKKPCPVCGAKMEAGEGIEELSD